MTAPPYQIVGILALQAPFSETIRVVLHKGDQELERVLLNAPPEPTLLRSLIGLRLDCLHGDYLLDGTVLFEATARSFVVELDPDWQRIVESHLKLTGRSDEVI